MRTWGWLLLAHLLLILSPKAASPGSLQSAPPTTPSGFAGEALSMDTIKWTWGASTGSTIITYEIHADPETSPPTVIASGLTNTSYEEGGLTENTQYRRHVHARATDQTPSGPSNADQKYTLIHTATTSDFSVMLASDTSAKIDVKEPRNAFADSTGAEIFRTVPTASQITPFSQAYTGTDSGLEPDKDYCYNIQFRNGDGIPSGPGPSPLCVHTPPGGPPPSDGCLVTVVKKVMCPEHDTNQFEWLVSLENNTEGKAAVLAYSDTRWVSVTSSSAVVTVPVKARPRTDVKEYLKGWCRIFDSTGEANRVAKLVKDLFAQRKKLIEDHRKLRSQINKLQEKMDKDLKKLFKEESDIVKAKDSAEQAAMAIPNYAEAMQERAAALRKDRNTLQAHKATLDDLQAQIDALDGQEDGIMEKIKDIDKKVTNLLEPPAEAVIAEVNKVEFKATDRPLDANPLWGGGQRIKPDGNDFDDRKESRKLKVRATAVPKIEGLHVHFKAFDRDDPGTNDPALDSNGPSGKDNFGQFLNQTWGFGGPTTTDKDTDADGIAEVDFMVTMQPGDNFEVAAGCNSEEIDQFTDDSASQNEVPYHQSSGMLTVWRRFFIERESMRAPVAGPVPDAGYIGSGDITNVTMAADQLTATVTLRPFDIDLLEDSPNRWVPGNLLSPNTAGGYPVVSTEVQADSIIVVVRTIKIGTTQTGPDAGTVGHLYDDDFKPNHDPRGVLPKLPEISEVEKTYTDAYLDVHGDVPRMSASLQQGLDLPVRINFPSAELPENPNPALKTYVQTNCNAIGARENAFWVGYVVMAFQGPYETDHDPDTEETLLGLNASDDNLGAFQIGAAVFAENYRDGFAATPNRDIPFLTLKTVAHELGHQWGLREDSGGIMDSASGPGQAQDDGGSSPLTLRQMHKIRQYPQSPGRRNTGAGD